MFRRITLDERAAQIAAVTERVLSMRGQPRLDANETMMFARQLEQIESRLFEVKYPDGHAIEIVPLLTSIDPGTPKYTWRFSDYSGKAKRVENWGTDFPRIDMQGKEVSHTFANYGISFGFDLQQLRSAKFAGYPLEQQLNVNARRVVMRELDSNLWFGDTAIGVYGLANSALITPTAEITGNWLAASPATPAQILADAQKLINACSAASKGVHKANLSVWAHSLFDKLATTFMDSANSSNVTVLDMLKKANPQVAFMESYQLELADAGGTGPRAIAGQIDSETAEGLVPTEFEVLPAIDQGGELLVKCMGRFGGVAVRYPGAIAYMDNLGT